MKVLSARTDRPQDKIDLHELAKVATPRDWDDAKRALAVMEKQGFARGRKLTARLSVLKKRHSRKRGSGR